MWHLGSSSSPSDTQLFAPSHLAAVLLSEVGPSREVAVEKGAFLRDRCHCCYHCCCCCCRLFCCCCHCGCCC